MFGVFGLWGWVYAILGLMSLGLGTFLLFQLLVDLEGVKLLLDVIAFFILVFGF